LARHRLPAARYAQPGLRLICFRPPVLLLTPRLAQISNGVNLFPNLNGETTAAPHGAFIAVRTAKKALARESGSSWNHATSWRKRIVGATVRPSTDIGDSTSGGCYRSCRRTHSPGKRRTTSKIAPLWRGSPTEDTTAPANAAQKRTREVSGFAFSLFGTGVFLGYPEYARCPLRVRL